MIRQMQKTLNITQIFIDSLCIFCNWIFSYYFCLFFLNQDKLRLFNQNRQKLFLLTLAFVLIHIFSYFVFNIYKSYRSSRFLIEIINITQANLVSYVCVTIFAYLFSYLWDVQIFITVFFFSNTLSILIYRFALRKALRHFRKKGYNRKYILLLGVNDCTNEFIKKINSSLELGYKIIGYMNSSQIDDFSLNYLGRTDGLDSYFKSKLVDEVILMPKDNQLTETSSLMETCEKWGVKFSLIPNIFSVFNSRVYVSSFDGLPVINIRKVPLDNILYLLIKRLFDVIFSFLLIAFFSPLMLFVATIIKISSKGPVLFKQVRVGLNRRQFYMYKFRSMKVESEIIIKMTDKNDDRCTHIGRFIRKCSVDELPQLINVLIGNMSLVGPRPEIPTFVEQFKDSIPSYMLKHYIKPGITGWAQINGLRGKTSIEDRIKFDMYYIENWTLFLDIKILCLSIFKGFFNKNAY